MYLSPLKKHKQTNCRRLIFGNCTYVSEGSGWPGGAGAGPVACSWTSRSLGGCRGARDQSRSLHNGGLIAPHKDVTGGSCPSVPAPQDTATRPRPWAGSHPVLGQQRQARAGGDGSVPCAWLLRAEPPLCPRGFSLLVSTFFLLLFFWPL